jgi:hypothetical protein
LARLAGVVLAFATTSVMGSPFAGADNAGKPMTFSWGVIGTAEGDTPAIFGDGDFTLDTPAALRTFLDRSTYTPDTRIFLNSLGGDLGAGMDVGRIIREAHLNTGVARNSRDPEQAGAIDLYANSRIYPGYCVSACTLAFLGGVSREVDPGATYAVHQVSMNCIDRRIARSRYPWVPIPGVNYCPELDEALAMVQIASGAVVEYVRSMGADPIFLTEMSKAGPNTVNALTEDQLDAYRINFTMRTESWLYDTDTQGQFFLRYTQGDEWKEDRVEFFCDRTGGPRLFLWLVHDTRRSTGRADPHRMAELASLGLTITWQLAAPRPDGLADIRSVMLQPFEIIAPPSVTEFDNLTTTIDVSQRFLEVLSSAETFQLLTTEPDDNTGRPLPLISFKVDRDKMAGIVRSCR